MASRALTSGTWLRWSQNRGRNGWDVASDIPEGMTAESLNVSLERNTLGKKRKGSATQSISGTVSGFLSTYRFVPPAGETSANVMIVDNSGTTKIGRVTAGTAFTDLTLKDNVSSVPQNARWATLNGKCYIAYDSTVNRLHVYDPTLSTSVVRRAGLATPAAASVANTGSGSYSGLRYYRVQWRVKSGSVVQRQSLLGTAVSFTPSGGTHARVTQPTVPSEGETHWAIYASEDGVSYYELTEVVIGTTTYDDNTATTLYSAGDPAPDEGAYTPFPSVKFILSTGERLVGFGVYESSAGDSLTPKPGRVFFSPVLDSSDVDDDERVSNTVDFQGWIDVGRNAGGEDRALAGPLDGNIFVFQSRGIYMLIPTGQADVPFRRVTLTTELGAVSDESTFLGEDEHGRACVYFLDPFRGPYRYGAQGFQWLGYDVQDVWATVNLAASTRVAAGVFDPELRACKWWLATAASNTLSEGLMFFVREAAPGENESVRGGWARWAEASASAFVSLALLPETIGATMSRTLKPYLGDVTNLRRWNDDSATQDGSTNYRGYVTSRAFGADTPQRFKRLGRTCLQASAHNGITITQSLSRNFGDETARTSTVLLTATGSETRIVRKFEDAALADVKTVQVTLGEAAAANQALWTLDEWTGSLEPTEEL